MRKLEDYQMGLLVRNVAILAFVALPLAVLSLVVSERIFPGPTRVSSVGDLLTPFLVALLPISVGGIFHQLLILKVAGRWSDKTRRLMSIASSPIVLGVLLLLVDWEYLVRLSPGVIVGLVVYNALSRPIPDGGTA